MITCHRVDSQLRESVAPWRDRYARDADLLILHYGHASDAFRHVRFSSQRSVLVYHGITPASFFEGTNPKMLNASLKGHSQISQWAIAVSAAICHSRFIASDLERAGFQRIIFLPYVLHEPLYKVPPDEEYLKRFATDGFTNLLTVGRVVPHKAIEDCIFTFDYFQRYVHPHSRLFIVGSWEGAEAYFQRLVRLVQRLGTRNVIFTGAVSQSALVSFYMMAHAYLLMSEHEGFGVSLVEAMRYNVPVFAYKSSAVSETLGFAGVQFSVKEWPVLAEAIGMVLFDRQTLEEVIEGQKQRVEFYTQDMARKRFHSTLDSLLSSHL